VTVDQVELATGAIGAFEIFVDGEKRFSKLDSGRFPEDQEVDALV
jgi:selT/selW/selH-like putative selenoprotein